MIYFHYTAPQLYGFAQLRAKTRNTRSAYAGWPFFAAPDRRFSTPQIVNCEPMSSCVIPLRVIPIYPKSKEPVADGRW